MLEETYPREGDFKKDNSFIELNSDKPTNPSRFQDAVLEYWDAGGILTAVCTEGNEQGGRRGLRVCVPG